MPPNVTERLSTRMIYGLGLNRTFISRPNLSESTKRGERTERPMLKPSTQTVNDNEARLLRAFSCILLPKDGESGQSPITRDLWLGRQGRQPPQTLRCGQTQSIPHRPNFLPSCEYVPAIRAIKSDTAATIKPTTLTSHHWRGMGERGR
jgi:hypothetical protein